MFWVLEEKFDSRVFDIITVNTALDENSVLNDKSSIFQIIMGNETWTPTCDVHVQKID